MTEIGKGKITG